MLGSVPEDHPKAKATVCNGRWWPHHTYAKEHQRCFAVRWFRWGVSEQWCTSGVKTERGTSVQKKPRETQCVANLRMPK